MSIRKIYNVIGIMSGTSMDGLDFSYIKTDGKNYVKIIYEKSYRYRNNYRIKLRAITKLYNLNKKIDTLLKHDTFVTDEFIKKIKKFINEFKINKSVIDFIGISGQTVFHDPKNYKSIQLGSNEKIQKKINIKIIGKFRENDIKNGGQGAPIGAFYHKYIINKISNKSAIVNIGGISNITFVKNKKLIAFDCGPGNALIDDLMFYFFKRNFDKNGKCASRGQINKNLIDKFQNDSYFNLKYPKSLDREHFKEFYQKLKKLNKLNSISTASIMTVVSIYNAVKLSNTKFDKLILTGGGRKNTFIVNELKKLLEKQKIKIQLIDKYNFDGDMLESQAFAYIAIRSFLKLPLSTPTTTGVKKPISGGQIFI